MEYCSGGELMENLARKGNLDEREVANIMSKALSAVKYLHEKGFVHRDIKPRNFMYASKEKGAEIKLVDFSLAHHLAPNETLHTQVGTPYYIAPEVLLGNYDHRCDIWSLGVMMYLLLSGEYPFEGKTTAILAKEIVSSPVDYLGKIWEKISTNAKDLVQKLLEKDPNKRISLAEALEHPWIKADSRSSVLDQTEATQILKNLKKYSIKNKLKKEVLDVLVSMLDDKELKRLREAFKYFDKDNTGEITLSELKQVIKEQKLKISDGEIKKIMKNVDVDESQKISLSEFLAAAMDQKFYQNREVLWGAFHHFDSDNSGQISAKDIRNVLLRAGKKPSQQEIDEMINQIDKSKDGLIDFEEFCHLMHVEDYQKDLAEEFEKINSTGKEVSVPYYRNNPSMFGPATKSQSQIKGDS